MLYNCQRHEASSSCVETAAQMSHVSGEMLSWGLTPDLSDSGRRSRWGPALPSFKRLAELKVAFKEGSPSCWADVWVTMGSVNGWESGLSSPVILCCHLRHLIVLPRQASDIKVNSSATHTWGLAPQIRFVSPLFSALLGTRTGIGLLAFIFPSVGYLLLSLFNVFIYTVWCTHTCI